MDKTMLEKVKQQFSEDEIPIFNKIVEYTDNNNEDFFIDFDEVWKLLDFSQKVSAIRLLEKKFTINVDYKYSQYIKENGRGGHNKQCIYIKLKTFKEFCLKSKTKKAELFNKCFLKLETSIHDYNLKEKDIQIEKLKNEKGKVPVIYFYSTDARDKNAHIKIGYTTCLNERIRPYNQITSFGDVIYKHEVDGDNIDLRLFEKFFHKKLHNFKVKNEIFNINTDEVKMMAQTDFMLYKLYKNENNEERKEIMEDIYNFVNERINGKKEEEPEENNETADAANNEVEEKIKKFIDEHCIIHNDAEISTKKIVGHFRLVYRNKKKEITNQFTEYLKKNFVMKRLSIQDSTSVVYGFKGITLKPINYEFNKTNSFEQRYAIECCVFKPDATVSFEDLFEKYKLFKNCNYNEEYNEQEDRKNLKKYFDSLKHVMYDTIHDSTKNCSSQGYYGVCLKECEKQAKISSTSKKVCKRNVNGDIICLYESVAKTAASENTNTPRITRSIQHKTLYENQAGEKYYFTYYQVLPNLNKAVENTNVPVL